MKLKCSKRLFLSKSGFTLIELLVVVLIIAVLAAVALPQYQKAVGKSRMAEVRTVVPTLLQAVRLYYLEMGHIPWNDTELSIDRPQSNYWEYFLDECLTINEKVGCHIEVYGKNFLSGITISFTEREYYEADGEDLAASWNCCDQSNKSDCSGTRCRNLLGFTTYDEDRGTWVE